MAKYKARPPVITAVQFKSSNLQDEAEINQLLGELVSFDNLMWFNKSTAQWESFEVGDWFVKQPLGDVVKMDAEMFERLYEPYE